MVSMLPPSLFGQLYVGTGPQFFLPLGSTGDVNESSIGATAHLELRSFCKLWFGIRFDYVSFKQVEPLLFTQDAFEDGIYFSPNIRYVFLGDDCFRIDLAPYVQGMLTFSSLGNTDGLNRLGLGGALGGGIAYGFNALDLCWIVDLNVLYSRPNALVRAEGRASLQSLNTSISLSVGL